MTTADWPWSGGRVARKADRRIQRQGSWFFPHTEENMTGQWFKYGVNTSPGRFRNDSARQKAGERAADAEAPKLRDQERECGAALSFHGTLRPAFPG